MSFAVVAVVACDDNPLITGKCSEAIDYAESCGVPDLELEDNVAGCSERWECRSACVLKAPCEEVRASFGAGGRDRTNAVYQCYEKCGI